MEEHLSREVLSLEAKFEKWFKYIILVFVALLLFVSTGRIIASLSGKRGEFGYEKIEGDEVYTEIDKKSVPDDTYATIEKNGYEFPQFNIFNQLA